MKLINLLPADTYTVINKTILTENDKKNLISLYEPIIGSLAVSLYLTFWGDLDKLEITSTTFNHHHLMSILKSNLESIKEAREILEGVGLIKTYFKEGEINDYVYELYSPLTANEFFNHPIFNVVLYNNVGKEEYDYIKSMYLIPSINLKDYTEISKMLNMSFNSAVKNYETLDVRKTNNASIKLENIIDFDLLISSMPKGIINEKTLTKKTKELINELAFIYNIDTLKMCEIIRTTINQNGCIDKEELRKSTRKYYQYNNSGSLPTLIYRTQPEYLKSPTGDLTNRGKIIYVFENTSPYDFLKSKYKTSAPTSRDLKLLESLVVDLELKPAVVNVLIDYVLKSNNNKLNQNFVETIAGQWKRLGIKTAEEAMEIAEKEHKKYNRRANQNVKVKKDSVEPVWFNDNIEKEELTDNDRVELEELFKEFR